MPKNTTEPNNAGVTAIKINPIDLSVTSNMRTEERWENLYAWSKSVSIWKFNETKIEKERSESTSQSNSDELAVSQKLFAIYETIEKIERLLEELKQNFDDLRERQLLFHRIKKIVAGIWEVDFPNDKNFLMMISLFEDAINYSRSEELTPQRLEALFYFIAACKKVGTVSASQVNEYQKLLLKNSFKTSPDID